MLEFWRKKNVCHPGKGDDYLPDQSQRKGFISMIKQSAEER